MGKFKNTVKVLLRKYGGAVACAAFAFVALAANSPCGIPFYEPEEPKGLEKFKKFN